MTYIYVKKFL